MMYCVCEVESFFDEEYDGSLCKVKKVLQVFNSESEANKAEGLFNPMNYDDYDTIIRVVSEDYLLTTFR